jgi:hypothetical protein
MRVRFSAVEEFLDELTQDAHLVEEGIIRVTLNYQPLEMKPLMLLAVRAGVIVNGKIVELHQTIGHVWSPPAGGQDDAKVRTRAQGICAQVEAQATALGLTIRRGLFQS